MAKFFNIDLHISVISDIKNILESLGHSVTTWCMSGSCFVVNREHVVPDVVNASNWQSFRPNWCDSFYNRYKNELSQYDAFIAAYPVYFAALYEKFEKPIYTVAPIRYEHPFSRNMEMWDWLNDKLRSMIDSGQLIPIANNKYDKKWCEHYTEREWKHIPSLCDYTGAKYTGKIKTNLLCGDTPKDIPNSIKKSELRAARVNGHWLIPWQHIYDHQSISWVPYAVSLMSIFEQYTANVPLLVPDVHEWPSCYSEAHENKPHRMLSDLYFYGCVKPDHRIFDADKTLCDFYDKEWMPYINYFKDTEELKRLLQTLDFKEISEKMKVFNVKRKEKIVGMWDDIT